MQTEFISLIAMTIIFLFAWFPVSVGKINTFGKKWAASNRDPLPGKELSGWAARCERAHNNLKDNFPGFVVAILLLGSTQQFDRSTEIVSIIYVISRLGHYFAYGIGHVLGRALFYMIGLGSNIFLLLKCIP